MNNVPNDATQPAVYDDIDSAAEAILGRWSDGENLSDDEELEATDEPLEETEEDTSDIEEAELEEFDEEETDEDPEEEEEPEEAEEDEDQDEDEELTLDDDTLVEIAVDGETKQASLKDLKRLYGQEASLTRKSQEVAAKRKEADEALQKTDLAYRKMLERAEARFKPYSEVDMLVASRQMSSEDFAALRREAREAEQDLKFLQEEANSFYQSAQQQMEQQRQQAAQEAVKVLSEQVPDWGNDLYNDIRSYAVSQGLPQEQVDQYVDPAVIMILNKARLYDQSKATAEVKKAKVAKVKAKSGKKVLRSKKAPQTDQDIKVQRQRKAQERLRGNPSRSGDLDDIAEVLLSRWER